MRAGCVIAIAGAAVLLLAMGRPFAEMTGLDGELQLSTEELLSGGRATALWIVTACAALAAGAGLLRAEPGLPLGSAVIATGVVACAVVLPQFVDPLFRLDELAVDPARRSGAVLAAGGAVAILAGGIASWVPAALGGPASGATLPHAFAGRILAAVGGLVLLAALFLRWSPAIGPMGWDEGTTVATAVFLAAILAPLAHLLWSMAGGEELGADAAVGLLGGAAAIAVSQVILQAPEGFGGASASQWLALCSAAAVGAGGYVEWRRPA